MIDNTIARRYATALFDVASENNCLDAVFNDMGLLRDVCVSNNDFSRMLHSPIIATSKKTAILKSVFSGKVQDISLQFILLISRKRRDAIIDLIAEAFISLYKSFKNIHIVKVITAIPLTDASRKQILESIANTVPGTIELIEEVNPDLIGGYKLMYDNNVYDATVSKQIQQLKKEFKDNLYIKQF